MDWNTQKELLARHAPIVRFDSRELFFPIAVDRYVENATLVVAGASDPEPTDAVPAPAPVPVAEADLDHSLPAGSYLQFVSDLERRSVVRAEARRLARKLLGPRLGRVGLFGRILDALFLLSVFIRPTTPRLTTAAVAIKAERLDLQREPVVYGRVVELAGWLVLHYAYFYAMNDWRSGYRGLNDHEADWEQAWIMCDPADHRPIWVVASSHEHSGQNLRRHWEDDECRRVGEHPVLYAGAGSHALYFRAGDYVTRIDVPGLRWLLRLQRWIRAALRIRDQAAERGLGPALGVPFVDAATGDGREINVWDLQHLDNSRACFGSFKGLWGLDTGDPTNGERGPSGPKFDRSGDIRGSWADPVGFAGLHGTSAPSRAPRDAVLANLDQTISYLNQEIVRTSRLLPLVQQAEASPEFQEESDRLTDLLRQRTELQDQQARLQLGERPERDMRAHLDNPATPLAPPQEAGWLLALWAAISVPLLLLSVAALFLFDGLAVSTLLLATAAGFSILEQLVRRHFQAVLRMLVAYLGIASIFVLLGAVFSGVLTVSLLAIGGIITAAAAILFVANLGELTAVQRRADAAQDE
ncbi:MAG: hypothetical protein AAGA65_26790 [Actinomycetota bacterium]